MHMTPISKSAIISQQYGLLMAQQNGTEAPSADAWRNIASLAVIRMHELEQDLRLSNINTSTTKDPDNQISQTDSEVRPISDSVDLIISAIRASVESPTPIEEAISRYSRDGAKENAFVDSALCVKGDILQPPTSPAQPVSDRKIVQRGWTYNYRGKLHDRDIYEAMAEERRKLIKTDCYSNTMERELIRKYIPDNTDSTTLNELGLLSQPIK